MRFGFASVNQLLPLEIDELCVCAKQGKYDDSLQLNKYKFQNFVKHQISEYEPTGQDNWWVWVTHKLQLIHNGVNQNEKGH